MSTKSNSGLLVIITVAVLLFISAIFWKNSNSDNSEQLYVEKFVSEEPVKKNKAEPIEDTHDIKHDENILSPEEKRAKQSKLMNKHIMFKTPEEVMKVILKLQELGKHEEADEYIDFLLKKYPDYEIK